MRLTTTLSRLFEYESGPYQDRPSDDYYNLVVALGPGWGENQPIDMLQVMELNGPNYCIRAIRTTVEDSRAVAREIALNCAEAALPAWEAVYPGDDRPRLVIQAARDFAAGRIGAEELKSARRAADDAMFLASEKRKAAARSAAAAAFSTTEEPATTAAEQAAYWLADVVSWTAVVEIIRRHLS